MKSLILKISGIIGAVGLVIFLVYSNPKQNRTVVSKGVTSEIVGVENGIHISTGLKAAENYELVVTNCTSCHSAKLVTQNRMSKNQWNASIRWMQETQNLWDLGEDQEKIVAYLIENYPIIDTGRRPNLIAVDWYDLED